ncbi:MAG TPA: hypothetical protein PKC77_11665, partial [Sphingopyxis sp.]|nr:hypothetical protein [Sphingopyxis sp.]
PHVMGVRTAYSPWSGTAGLPSGPVSALVIAPLSLLLSCRTFRRDFADAQERRAKNFLPKPKFTLRNRTFSRHR